MPISAFGLLTLILAAPPPSGTVWVTNEASGDLTVIELGSRAVVATIPVGKRPRGLRVLPGGRQVMVAVSGSPWAEVDVDDRMLPLPGRNADGLAVVDVVGRRMLRTLPSGDGPQTFDLSHDATRAFVSNEDAAQVSIVEVSTGRRLGIVPVGAEPEGVTSSPDGRAVYVTSERDGSRLYVTTGRGGALVVLDAKTEMRWCAPSPGSARGPGGWRSALTESGSSRRTGLPMTSQ